MTTDTGDYSYAGFWIRTAAALIDSILLLFILSPVIYLVYGPSYWQGDQLISGFWDFILNYVLPAIAVIVFWIFKSATPGKILLDLKIIDAETGGKPGTAQCIGRYFAYYVSMIPFMLGILWVAFDRRKQGWHDKLAGTLVVKDTDLET